MFEWVDCELPGVKLIRPLVRADERGAFVKVLHEPTFTAAGVMTGPSEIYYSTSKQNVIRGLHLQLPPHDLDKHVFCMAGEALDVVVDLRRGSPSFGRTASFALSAAEGTGVYAPTGCAHGLLSLTDDCLMLYMVNAPYAPEHDTGVRWDSVGFDWPVAAPIVSARDAGLPTLDAFDSPFFYSGSSF